MFDATLLAQPVYRDLPKETDTPRWLAHRRVASRQAVILYRRGVGFSIPTLGYTPVAAIRARVAALGPDRVKNHRRSPAKQE